MSTNLLIAIIALLAGLSLVVSIAVLYSARKEKRAAREHELNLDEDEGMLGGGSVGTTERLNGKPAIRLGQLLADKSRTVVSTVMQACLVYGPSGSGKTSSLLVENIVAWPSEAFMCVSTTKAELAQVTARARAAKPGETVVFDPSNLLESMEAGSTGSPDYDFARECVQTWTPIVACTGWDASLEVAEALIAATKKSEKEQSDFWETQVKVLLAVAMMIQRNERRVPGSLQGADRWVMDLSQQASKSKADSADEVVDTAIEQLKTMIDAHARMEVNGSQPERDAHLEHEYTAALEQIEKVSHTLTADDTAAGIIGNVTSVMVDFSRIGTVYRTHWADDSVIDIAALVRTPGATIYSVSGKQPMRAVVTAFIGEVVKQLQAHANTHRNQALPIPALLCLDELVNSSPHPQLGYWLSEVFRQNKIKALLATQTPTQLRGTYGKEESSVIEDNVSELVVLGGAKDTDYLEWVSKIAGDKVMMVKTRSETVTSSESFEGTASLLASSRSKSKAKGWSEQRVERKMVSPARLFNMPLGQGLVLMPRMGVAHVSLSPFDQDDAIVKACEGHEKAIRHVQTRVKKTGWKSDEPV